MINIKFHLISRALSGQKKMSGWGKIIAILPPTVHGLADARNRRKTTGVEKHIYQRNLPHDRDVFVVNFGHIIHLETSQSP